MSWIRHCKSIDTNWYVDEVGLMLHKCASDYHCGSAGNGSPSEAWAHYVTVTRITLLAAGTTLHFGAPHNNLFRKPLVVPTLSLMIRDGCRTQCGTQYGTPSRTHLQQSFQLILEVVIESNGIQNHTPVGECAPHNHIITFIAQTIPAHILRGLYHQSDRNPIKGPPVVLGIFTYYMDWMYCMHACIHATIPTCYHHIDPI